MINRRASGLGVVLGSVLATLAILAPGAEAASKTVKVALRKSASPVAASTPSAGSVPASTSIPFEIDLKLSDQSGAASFAQSVSTPGTSDYGKFLTPAQWEQRYSPSQATVSKVIAFLKQNGFTGVSASADRMAIEATGTAAQIERVFSTQLAYHRVKGMRLRLATRNLSVPSNLAGGIAGISGVSETLEHPQSSGNPATGSPTSSSPSDTGSYQQPPGFRVAPPCDSYYGQSHDTFLPPFGQGYPADPPWAVCGYTPPQIRTAYGLNAPDDGSGVTVAVVDAYTSPTLFSDAHKYANLNDPGNPLRANQFSELPANSYDHAKECGPPGWFGEETLDVEAVHATAPGANVLVAGAKNCNTGALNTSLRKIVDGHLAQVISNSYGDDGGDALDTAGDRASTDDILMMAAGTGVSVMFSSGDDGDEYTTVGQVAADYPASSPWATAVGGTTLQIGSNSRRTGEFGWSTARSQFCNQALVNQQGCTTAQLRTWLPIDETLDGGSGGGVSVSYPQPIYQRGVVPTSLSEQNGATPMRVVPDVSMDADPGTGFLEGETQTFPDGVYYDQYRIGGTSVSSPLFAGLVARADELTGHSLGLVNGDLYAQYGRPGAFFDVGPAGLQDQSRADYANEIDSSEGILYSTRLIGYEGQEEYCDQNNNCSYRNVAISATPGYDDMTGLGAPANQLVADLALH